MPAWSFVLADKGFNQVDELLNIYDRKVSIPMSKLDTCSFRARLDHPHAAELLAEDGYIKAYRDGVLQFYGPIISAQETGSKEGQSIAVNCAGAGWLLSKRFGAMNNAFPPTVMQNGFSFTSTDRAEIVRQLIIRANAINETGIDTSNAVSSGSSMSFVVEPFKYISETLSELSQTIDGFDWRILPYDNLNQNVVTSSKIGQFYAVPVMGQATPEAFFEYGGRGNIESYDRTVNRDTQANEVWHVTSAGASDPQFGPVVWRDTGAILDWRLLQALAQGDITDPTLRSALVKEHVKVRKLPRQTITFTPHIDPDKIIRRLPVYGVEYGLGDRVRARAVVRGATRFDVMVRVYGIAFDIDSNGVEKQTLTLVDEGA